MAQIRTKPIGDKGLADVQQAKCLPQKPMIPRLSWYIQFHIWALTTVRMAHGIRIAVRIRPLPLILALITRANPSPKSVSSNTETAANRTVFHSDCHQMGSANIPTQRLL